MDGKIFNIGWVIWVLFILSLFIIPGFLPDRRLLDIYAFLVGGTLLSWTAFYDAFHAKEHKTRYKLRPLPFFHRLLPIKSNNRVMQMIDIFIGIVSLGFAFFAGLLPLLEYFS